MADEISQQILTQLNKISVTVARMEERMLGIDERVDKMERKMERKEEQRQAKSWQMWFLIISVIVGGLSGWAFAILKT